MKKNVLDLFSKFLEGGGVTRRGAMKSFVAVGAASALYGCGKDDDSTDYYYPDPSIEPDPTPPKIAEYVVAGVTPHNCGGSCLTKSYVRGGVIKRISTDETPEKYLAAPKGSPEYGDFIQNRNCPRCRATKSWVYGTNRLMYPLIQTKERGNLSGFRRVTWEQAAQYYKAKVEYIRKTWGGSAHYNTFGTGGWGATDISNANTYLGGSAAFSQRHNYSRPGFQFLSEVVGTRDGSPPPGDDWGHIVSNTEEMVLWGVNYSENGQTEQAGWYLKQMRELGKKITMIETRVNQTTVTIADKFLPILAGTDGALAHALMYCMLTDYREDLFKTWGITTGTEAEKNKKLRRTVGKYIYGFFDAAQEDDDDGESTNHSYRYTSGPEKALFDDKFRVGKGMSLSAYIRGSEVDPCNQGSSVYPEDIGYNVATPEQFPNMLGNSTDAPKSDRLYGARVPCYGQVPKTPEWAERITGIKADDIRELAKKLATKNVNITFGGGLQRNSESDFSLWSCLILCYFARCFGASGRNYGSATPRNQITDASGIAGHRWNANGVSSSRYRADIPSTVVHDGSTTSAGYLTAQTGYMNPEKSGLYTGLNNRLGNNHAMSFTGNYAVTSEPTSRFNSYGDFATTHGAVSRAVAIVNWLDFVEASHSTNTFTDPAGLRGQVKPSRWFNAQVMGCYAPVKMLTAFYSGAFLNQSPDTNHAVRVYTAKDSALENGNIAVPGTDIKMNPYGYKIEFLWGHECVMSPGCRWMDMILPGTAQFERFQIQNFNRNDQNKSTFTHKAVNPPGEALPEIAIGGEIAKAFGEEDNYFTSTVGGNAVSFKGTGSNIFERAYDFEYKAWNARFLDTDLKTPLSSLPQPGDPYAPAGGLNSMQKWAPVGMYKNYKDALEQPQRPPMDSGYFKDPAAAMKTTASGRIDAFSVGMMECYEGRFFPNIDKTGGRLAAGVKFYTKLSQEAHDAAPTENIMNYKRIVYPIPMYVPIIEGLHACDNAGSSYYMLNGIDLRHPNPMQFDLNDGWTNQVSSWHPIIRSHSTFASVPLLNELKYWKRDSKGNPAYINRNITNARGGADHFNLTAADTGAPSVWQDDVYEVAWLNPKTKYANGLDINEGDVIVVESLRGKILVSAHLSQRVPPRLVALAQGSWYDPINTVNHGNVDRGGCINTLISTRGSRVNQSNAMACDTRVRIEKFRPHTDDKR